MSEEMKHLREQVSLARTEIKNLRLQITALKHEHHKNIETIKSCLNCFRCPGCTEQIKRNTMMGEQNSSRVEICYKPIGHIQTGFMTKRAVPRQPNIVSDVHGTLVLDTSVFNNPEHAMDGLQEFSHLWIIFDMHLAHSLNPPAVVSPPRLRGERIGVLSTRSPHRPCPIGLSLVRIISILGNKIVFEGVDMINGTPVLDIKPYIPQYDLPSTLQHRNDDVFDTRSQTTNDSVEIESPTDQTTYPNLNSLRVSTAEGSAFPPPDLHSPRLETERGAPDGQERLSPPHNLNVGDVRVPQWITERRTYEVHFTDDAYARLVNIIGDRADQFKTTLQSLLAEDPRSEYVRTRYPDSEYSCVLEEVCVTCTFNDVTQVCTVIGASDDMQAS